MLSNPTIVPPRPALQGPNVTFTVHVNVTNSGNVSGATVVQVYALSPPLRGVNRARLSHHVKTAYVGVKLRPLLCPRRIPLAWNNLKMPGQAAMCATCVFFFFGSFNFCCASRWQGLLLCLPTRPSRTHRLVLTMRPLAVHCKLNFLFWACVNSLHSQCSHSTLCVSECLRCQAFNDGLQGSQRLWLIVPTRSRLL